MTVPMLSVNVDHVATVRQARRVPYPDPVEAARLAEAAGARGITAHLRADRRHIQEHDVARLREAVTTRLNLEIAATEEMVKVALEHRPDLVSLVPETPDEITTEGGLDLTRHRARVEEVARRLAGAGIAVSHRPNQREARLSDAAGAPARLISVGRRPTISPRMRC
jgi:pyridoxine 5-phosphate synthase